MAKKQSTGAEQSAFAQRLKALTRDRGAVSRLAEAAGVSDSVIRRWRLGQVDPTRASLVALARAAGVTVQWLAAGEEPKRVGEPAPVEARVFGYVAKELELAMLAYGPRASGGLSEAIKAAYSAGDLTLDELVQAVVDEGISEIRARVGFAAERAMLVAEVYNRAIAVPGGKRREGAIRDEARQFARFAEMLQGQS